MTPRNFWLGSAATFGGIAVVLGAFGAHVLESRLTDEMLTVYDTGVRYHLYHTLAMLVVALTLVDTSRWARWACRSWAAGILVFSGSLYFLAATGARWLGAITPIGGVAFIVGWACLVGLVASRTGE